MYTRKAANQILDHLDENCKFDLPEDLVKNEQEIVKHSFIHEKAHKDEPHDDHKHGHDHSDIKLTKEEEDDILDISKRRVFGLPIYFRHVYLDNMWCYLLPHRFAIRRVF